MLYDTVALPWATETTLVPSVATANVEAGRLPIQPLEALTGHHRPSDHASVQNVRFLRVELDRRTPSTKRAGMRAQRRNVVNARSMPMRLPVPRRITSRARLRPSFARARRSRVTVKIARKGSV